MNKTFLTTAFALALCTSVAHAQPSQGQAGANTGPTSNSANSQSAPASQNNSMQGGTTSGVSSGGGSGMTTSGGANGNPGGMPKTTTGPTGPASKDESPPK